MPNVTNRVLKNQNLDFYHALTRILNDDLSVVPQRRANQTH